jgi:GDP-4-dehydro-6-deoxy-D-mannose reductase
MRALITGITGMIGAHCARACRARGWETFGIARNSASSRLTIDDPGILRCDVLDLDALETIFRKTRPDVVFHMAAQAFNGLSWQMEWTTHQANYLGTANVLRCCRLIVPQSKIVIACSSAEYGDVQPDDCPLKEDRPLRPITPYGVSKVATEALGFQHFHNYGMQIFLPRLFIHVGTGHPPATAIQNFARQIALVACSQSQPVIQVGNMDTQRDFIDVRDGVRALMMLVDAGEPSRPVNICNGEAVSIREALNMLIRISKQDVRIESDPSLFRPSDEPLLLGDNSRLRALGWKRQYNFLQTLEAVYEDWVMRLSTQRIPASQTA